MRLRQKPKKPTRKKNYEIKRYIDCETVAELVEGVGEEFPGKPLDDIKIDYGEIGVVWRGLEPDDLFETRMEEYRKKKDSYDRWYNENKKEVKDEVDRRERERLIKLERRKVHLQRQVDKALREISKIDDH